MRIHNPQAIHPPVGNRANLSKLAEGRQRYLGDHKPAARTPARKASKRKK